MDQLKWEVRLGQMEQQLQVAKASTIHPHGNNMFSNKEPWEMTQLDWDIEWEAFKCNEWFDLVVGCSQLCIQGPGWCGTICQQCNLRVLAYCHARDESAYLSLAACHTCLPESGADEMLALLMVTIPRLGSRSPAKKLPSAVFQLIYSFQNHLPLTVHDRLAYTCLPCRCKMCMPWHHSPH
jgi:hypothetical protein